MIQFLSRHFVYLIFIGIALCWGALSSLAGDDRVGNTEGFVSVSANLSQTQVTRTYTAMSNRSLIRQVSPSSTHLCNTSYSFATASGQQIVVNAPYFDCVYHSTVEVLYDPADPEDNYVIVHDKPYKVRTATHWLLCLVLAAAGLAMTLTGAVFAVLNLGKKKSNH